MLKPASFVYVCQPAGTPAAGAAVGAGDGSTVGAGSGSAVGSTVGGRVGSGCTGAGVVGAGVTAAGACGTGAHAAMKSNIRSKLSQDRLNMVGLHFVR